MRKAAGDEMTLWVEDEEVVRSSRDKKNNMKATTKKNTANDSKNVIDVGARNVATSESKPAGVQLTERDVDTIGWLADQYAVRTDVIRWLLGNGAPLSDSRTRAIVARWQRAGIVDSRRFFAGAPQVVWPTRTGMALVRPGWRAKPPTLSLLAHHHAVSQVRLAIERRGQGSSWVCERVLYKERSTPDAHVPDGRFRSARGPVTAVEVELTLKAADRLRDIVRDLTLDHEAVLYVVGDATIGRAVTAAADAVGESPRVHVVDLARLDLGRA